ncbi:VOC family protein [Niveibacterium sp. SC-1]|uniref:VOC family protein n=1 Tax=Niveibacterium sp. SC-1 TaxID=3135646 RepID=UPI00312016AA
MIDHTGISVSDIAVSRGFYEKTLAVLGYSVLRDFGTAVGLGTTPGLDVNADPGGDFWIHEGEVMTPRVHVAFTAESRAAVDAFYTAALAAGGRDNGAPGLRPNYHARYYAAFVFDPDGYNIEAVFHQG